MSAPQTSAYRDAMARLGAAVNVITTGTLENPVGFTASAVCSVTDTPPTLLVCLNRASRVREFFHVGAPLCVNVLSASQEELSGHFASANSMEERFALGHWDTLSTGAPALKEAVATFDCLISQIVEVGTHSVLFGTVQALRSNDEADGLAYFRRAYHTLKSILP
ncbi:MULTISPECIES: flavin reductase [Acetobacter]|jgi:flavin reductase|uniref:FMN reductase (NADH) RutF n=1 Tax=Acetobacter peroxydans TaxID=104098 RepID=A0A4Y3TV63_9PROT|nr:flavin reductase [Acetobacter peroxydans]MCH4142935.1 flavin reductase [Acetobacter peroxydans]MCI1394702.1 flavin reductase [Acetobacter peroxydans]MCI1412243.1 flavin reductase [Acetobacter peroxydans]MCI1440785.1 flavin reductase [Acetobacter peroxydans]MCI1566647.1 flavin reductase [Acetobacter peroxydans]